MMLVGVYSLLQRKMMKMTMAVKCLNCLYCWQRSDYSVQELQVNHRNLKTRKEIGWGCWVCWKIFGDLPWFSIGLLLSLSIFSLVQSAACTYIDSNTRFLVEVDYVAWVCHQIAYACSGQKLHGLNSFHQVNLAGKLLYSRLLKI